MCSDLYIYFLTTIGKDSYYPSGASEVSDNRMYHSSTPTYNKEVILKSMEIEDGTIRVVFAIP